MASIPNPDPYYYTSYNSYTHPNGWYSAGFTVDQSTQKFYPYTTASPVALPKIEFDGPNMGFGPEKEPEPESALIQWLRSRVGEITELAWA